MRISLFSILLAFCFLLSSVSYASSKEEQGEELQQNSSCSLHEKQIEAVRQAFASRDPDFPLVFSGEPLTYKHCMNLKEVLMHQSISHINFNHCTGIGDSGLKLLADAFATMPRLGILEFVNIGMTDEGCTYLCQKLTSQKQIGNLPFKSLDLRNNNIKESSVQALINLKVVHPDLSYSYGWTSGFNFSLLSTIDHFSSKRD